MYKYGRNRGKFVNVNFLEIRGRRNAMCIIALRGMDAPGSSDL